MNAENTALRQEWQTFKATLTFSHIRCFVCDEPMYYGKQVRVTKGTKKPKFLCNCKGNVILFTPEGNKCGECDREVTYNTQKLDGFIFRCTCGHTDICTRDKIDETHKL